MNTYYKKLNIALSESARNARITHAPDPIRATVSLMNNDDFAKDFSCASQTRMNPQKKCRIW